MNFSIGAVAPAPGVQVNVQTSGEPLRGTPLGASLIVGGLHKGPPGVPVRLSGRGAFLRALAGASLTDGADLAVRDFFDAAGGVGELWAMRVTGGQEVAASARVMTRNVSPTVIQRAPNVAPDELVITAASGGRHGGRRSILSGFGLDVSAAVSGVTLDLGLALTAGAWEGATLAIPALSWSATVLDNDAAGVVTLDGSLPAAVAASTDSDWTLELDNVSTVGAESADHVAIRVIDGHDGTTFGIVASRDGAPAQTWTGLQMAEESATYWIDAVNDSADDRTQWEIRADDSDLTVATSSTRARIANYAGIAEPGSTVSEVIEVSTVFWDRTGTGNFWIDPIDGMTWGSDPRACDVVLTFTSSSAFDVAATYADGGQSAGTLPSGTVGAAYSSPNAWLPGFTVTDGTASAVAGDTLTIKVRPLPDLAGAGAYLYPSATDLDGSSRVRLAIKSTTHRTITLSSSAASYLSASAAPVVTGSTAGPFDLSGSSLTLIFSIVGPDGTVEGPYTLTESSSGASLSATSVASALQTLENARAGSAGAALLQFGASTDNKVRITARKAWGGSASIKFGAGTLNSVLGFTTNQTASGTSGGVFRLEYDQQLSGGVDDAPTASDLAAAFALGEGSPLAPFLSQPVGLAIVSVPGAAASVQTEALRWAAASGMMALLEIPAAQTTEASAIAWFDSNLAIGAQNDHGPVLWPSFGVRRNPYGSGTATRSLAGAFLGARAAQVAAKASQAIAPAGLQFGALFSGLPTGERPLDLGALAGKGLIPVRRVGNRIETWGGRIPGATGPIWFHKVAAILHIARDLLATTESLVWSRIDGSTMIDARRKLAAKFRIWSLAGWFERPAGLNVGEEVAIVCDESNNDATTAAAGDLHVELGFSVVGTAERVIFNLDGRSVSVQG
jgi:hypothetical protein